MIFANFLLIVIMNGMIAKIQIQIQFNFSTGLLTLMTYLIIISQFLQSTIGKFEKNHLNYQNI